MTRVGDKREMRRVGGVFAKVGRGGSKCAGGLFVWGKFRKQVTPLWPPACVQIPSSLLPHGGNSSKSGTSGQLPHLAVNHMAEKHQCGTFGASPPVTSALGSVSDTAVTSVSLSLAALAGVTAAGLVEGTASLRDSHSTPHHSAGVTAPGPLAQPQAHRDSHFHPSPFIISHLPPSLTYMHAPIRTSNSTSHTLHIITNTRTSTTHCHHIVPKLAPPILSSRSKALLSDNHILLPITPITLALQPYTPSYTHASSLAYITSHSFYSYMHIHYTRAQHHINAHVPKTPDDISAPEPSPNIKPNDC